jgi:antitoxin HicB
MAKKHRRGHQGCDRAAACSRNEEKEDHQEAHGRLMRTSRAQVDRLLDPDNGSATIESLQRATKIVGRGLRLALV